MIEIVAVLRRAIILDYINISSGCEIKSSSD